MSDLMLGLQRHCDVNRPGSLSNRLRTRRFAMFTALLKRLGQAPVTIIDVGGTTRFWEMRGWADRDDVRITLVNLAAEEQRHENIRPVVGDATDLRFGDDAFDIAFSNSVIEHLFTFENQQRMAREMQRVARAHWVQTPNYWFPIEPHFHVPGWQWLPRRLRVGLLMRRRCGWRGPCSDRTQAEALVDEVRLMTRRELFRLFPGSTVHAERLGGLVKSWIVHGGFPE